jgi:hypothetical protein
VTISSFVKFVAIVSPSIGPSRRKLTAAVVTLF